MSTMTVIAIGVGYFTFSMLAALLLICAWAIAVHSTNAARFVWRVYRYSKTMENPPKNLKLFKAWLRYSLGIETIQSCVIVRDTGDRIYWPGREPEVEEHA